MLQYLGQLHASRITCAELYAHGYRSNANQLLQIETMLSDLKIMEFDNDCAREYGRLHARLADRGRKCGMADLMIAATALVHGLVLVTHDGDFSAFQDVIPELRLEDWLAT